jgi:hypothetical protein
VTRAPDLREIAATAARAASDVPGVARLTPRPGGRLALRLAAGPARRPRPSALVSSRSLGVRVLPHGSPHRTTVEICLAVRTGHRAVAVAHQVRVAVVEALHANHPRVWATDVTVSVTVTAIV